MPVTLAEQVRLAERPRRLAMWGLVAPALLFLLIAFIVPLAIFLTRSVYDPEVAGALPRTLRALAGWSGRDLPDEAAFAALVADLRRLEGTPELATLGRRLNYNIAGFRSLLLRAGTHLPPDGTPSYRAALIAVDPRWGELRYWQVISSQGGLLTPFYVLSALDLAQDHDGAIRRAAPENALYRQLFLRTLWISGSVTLLCLAIGFPLAYVMASASAATSNWLMIVVLVPFWASLLVRTTAWIILLQTQGLVNQALLALGILSAPARLVYNRTGVLIAMTHVLLPFLVLPLYSVMRRIPAEHMRAAASLGAHPVTAFLHVYLPQASPGVAAGCALVFVLALGYYITPALVGGPADQMVSYFIAYFTNESVNWGMASALGAILLVVVVGLYLALGRLIGFDRLNVR